MKKYDKKKKELARKADVVHPLANKYATPRQHAYDTGDMKTYRRAGGNFKDMVRQLNAELKSH